MAGCRTSIVSILNNDDHPSFAVRPAGSVSKRPSDSGLHVHRSRTHRQSPSDSRYAEYPCSPTESLRDLQRPNDSLSRLPSQSLSPGSPDGRHEYFCGDDIANFYRSPVRPDSHADQPVTITSGVSRLSIASPPAESMLAQTPLDRQDPSRGSRIRNKYPCPYAASHGCTATFTTSGHAARHGKKHTGEKSVHCPICSKAFTRKDNMKQHIRTHRTPSEDSPTDADKESERAAWPERSGHVSSQSHSRSMSQSHHAGGYVRSPPGSHGGLPYRY